MISYNHTLLAMLIRDDKPHKNTYLWYSSEWYKEYWNYMSVPDTKYVKTVQVESTMYIWFISGDLTIISMIIILVFLHVCGPWIFGKICIYKYKSLKSSYQSKPWLTLHISYHYLKQTNWWFNIHLF